MILNMGAGGASTAETIQYDNSASGLESDNVQCAVDELKESLKWKLLGTVTGTTKVALPETFNEISIIVKPRSAQQQESNVVTIPYIHLTDSDKRFEISNQGDVANYIRVLVSKTAASQYSIYFSGTDYTSQSTMFVYCR